MMQNGRFVRLTLELTPSGIKNMPRLPRLKLPGHTQHIVQRGNNRQDCFFEEQDYTESR